MSNDGEGSAVEGAMCSIRLIHDPIGRSEVQHQLRVASRYVVAKSTIRESEQGTNLGRESCLGSIRRRTTMKKLLSGGIAATLAAAFAIGAALALNAAPAYASNSHPNWMQRQYRDWQAQRHAARYYRHHYADNTLHYGYYRPRYFPDQRYYPQYYPQYYRTVRPGPSVNFTY